MEVSRRRETKSAEVNEVNRLRLCKSLGELFVIILLKRTILNKIHCNYAKYHWQVATYHVYKKISKDQKTRLSVVSTFADKIRKCGFQKIFISREVSEDGSFHYHILVGNLRRVKRPNELLPDEIPMFPLPIVKNSRLWSRPFIVGTLFSYKHTSLVMGDDGFEQEVCMPHVICIDSTGINPRDLGFRQRWLRYGIDQYLLYCMKYLGTNSHQYVHYYCYSK